MQPQLASNLAAAMAKYLVWWCFAVIFVVENHAQREANAEAYSYNYYRLLCMSLIRAGFAQRQGLAITRNRSLNGTPTRPAARGGLAAVGGE